MTRHSSWLSSENKGGRKRRDSVFPLAWYQPVLTFSSVVWRFRVRTVVVHFLTLSYKKFCLCDRWGRLWWRLEGHMFGRRLGALRANQPETCGHWGLPGSFREDLRTTNPRANGDCRSRQPKVSYIFCRNIYFYLRLCSARTLKKMDCTAPRTSWKLSSSLSLTGQRMKSTLLTLAGLIDVRV